VLFVTLHFKHESKPIFSHFWDMKAVARDPHVFILGGDNVYADRKNKLQKWVPATPARISELYQQLDSLPAFAKLRGSLAAKRDHDLNSSGGFDASPRLIGTWDDHDFGVNDGDGTLPFKRESVSHRCLVDPFD
jgi:alkaline phosphatase D